MSFGQNVSLATPNRPSADKAGTPKGPDPRDSKISELTVRTAQLETELQRVTFELEMCEQKTVQAQQMGKSSLAISQKGFEDKLRGLKKQVADQEAQLADDEAQIEQLKAKLKASSGVTSPKAEEGNAFPAPVPAFCTGVVWTDRRDGDLQMPWPRPPRRYASRSARMRVWPSRSTHSQQIWRRPRYALLFV